MFSYPWSVAERVEVQIIIISAVFSLAMFWSLQQELNITVRTASPNKKAITIYYIIVITTDTYTSASLPLPPPLLLLPQPLPAYVQVLSHDPDSGGSGSVRYTLTRGNKEDHFNLHRRTGVLTLKRPLDREQVITFSSGKNKILSDKLIHCAALNYKAGSYNFTVTIILRQIGSKSLFIVLQESDQIVKWMAKGSRFGSSGVSSTLRGVATTGKRLARAQLRSRNFFSCSLYFSFAHFYASHYLCFFLFQSYCSHAKVFGKTLVHEIHIFYCHTEWCY